MHMPNIGSMNVKINGHLVRRMIERLAGLGDKRMCDATYERLEYAVRRRLVIAGYWRWYNKTISHALLLVEGATVLGVVIVEANPDKDSPYEWIAKTFINADDYRKGGSIALGFKNKGWQKYVL